MKRTEAGRSADLAAALFDQVITPLAERKRSNECAPYFQRHGDPAVSSYFARPRLATMRPADFELPGGGTADGIIDAAAAFWTEEGETDLAALASRLKEIAAALRREAREDSGDVDPLCYTLF